MSDDLKADLQAIDGIGEVKAEKILDVLSDYDTAEDPYVQKARDAADAGEYREAGVYLQRANGGE